MGEETAGLLRGRGADVVLQDRDETRVDDLGRRLRQARLSASLTLRELARQADVSPALVSLVENGKSQPSVSTLYTFARILDVSVDELFESGGQVGELGGAAGGVAGPSSAVDVRHGAAAGMDPIHAWAPSEYANRISVAHPSHRPQLTMAEGVVWERLAATPERGVNFMKISYLPGATSTAGGDLLTHAGYEYGYVLSGEIEVTVGHEVFLLRRDESLGFDSAIPHVLRNTGEETFEGLWFVHGAAHTHG